MVVLTQGLTFFTAFPPVKAPLISLSLPVFLNACLSLKSSFFFL